jgi:hypothetical protein
MINDSAAILDDLLSRWHHHCKGYSPVPVQGADPMFRMAVRPRGYDTATAIMEDEAERIKMEAMDFHVYELGDPHRSAILILARNCYTGRSVWLSPRLPKDPMERGVIVGQARSMLTRRLMAAGVM